MKVLITGVAGLLGSRLADWIIKNHPEVQVVGIDDLSGGYLTNVNPKVNLWQMNLVNHPINNCFEDHKFDYVFHFAAYAAEGLSPFIRQYNYENNLVYNRSAKACGCVVGTRWDKISKKCVKKK